MIKLDILHSTQIKYNLIHFHEFFKSEPAKTAPTAQENHSGELFPNTATVLFGSKPSSINPFAVFVI